MIFLPSAIYSGFVFPLYHSWLSLHNWGMLQILVNIFQLFINIVQCYIVVKWQAFITLPSKAIFELFSREMLSLHSHLNHQCRRITGCFEGFILIYVSIQAHYVVWSSSEAPQPLFSAKSIFFSGLTAGPTYQPPVWHSNPDAPLENFESIAWRGWRVTFITEIITCFECWSNLNFSPDLKANARSSEKLTNSTEASQNVELSYTV